MRRIITICLFLVGAFPPVVLAQPGSDRELIAGLVAALDDPDGEVRQNVAIALANLGDDAIPALLEALTDAKAERRAGAAAALGQIRPIARSAIPGLMEALRDRDENVRRQASYALSRMVRKTSAVAAIAPERLPNVPPPDPTPMLPAPVDRKPQ